MFEVCNVSRMAVSLNGEPFEEWIILSTWGSKWQRMEDVKGCGTQDEWGYKSWGSLKIVLSHRELVINAKMSVCRTNCTNGVFWAIGACKGMGYYENC